MIVNNKYNGFTLLEKKFIEDINSTAYLFNHDNTNAGLVFLENDDKNKAFSVSFKTPPQDETGLTHILEHCVLSGSKKYPVKSPFLEMRKGSLSTFLNAMTFADKTMYPVASINDKDFKNLTDVYLDAVFNPLVLEKEEIFLQEGWRYEVDSETGALKYNGIVFNEMKGAYSSPDRVLINQIKTSLYPDNAYGLDSGGNPDYITDLDYDKFREYHQKHYHPSNSYFYLYGDLNILEYLEYIDQEYLSVFSKNEEDYNIPWQEVFSEEKSIRETYAIGKDQKKDNKTYLAKNYVVGKITDKTELIALMILEKIFFDVTGSELKKRLMNAEIAEEIDGFLYMVGQQPFFTFLARNSEEKHFQEFDSIIREYLNEIAMEKIEEELLTGAINSIEFRLRESALSPGKGINYAQGVMNSWLYGEDPFLFLSFSEDIACLRKKAEEGYFEKLIIKYFFENKHASSIILLPEHGIDEKKKEETERKLLEIQNKSALEDLVKYKVGEEAPEDVSCIPVIDINDISRKQEEIPLEVIEKDNIEILLHPMFTNKLIYIDLYFNTQRVAEDKIKYIYLLSDILTSVSTKNYDYQKLSRLINIYTGGIDFSVLCLTPYNTEEIVPMMRVSSKTFPENLDKTLSILKEVISSSLFSDKKKLKEELIELKAIKENDFLDDSMGIAQTRLSSYFTLAGKYLEEGNVEYYYFLKEVLENYDEKFEEFAKDLKETAENIFAQNNLKISITNDPESIESVVNSVLKYLKELPASYENIKEYKLMPENLLEGISIPAKVHYVIKGGNFNNKGHSYNGSMRVAAKILNTDYLWNKLRVTGGAYGGFASVSLMGNIVFSSYRDPNITETLDAYDKSGDFFRSLNLSERDLSRFIIGTIGDYDAPMSVSSKSRISNVYYFQRITQKDLQKIREEILAAKMEDLNSFGDTLDAVTKQNIYCVIGNEESLAANDNLFKKIIKIN